MQRTEWRLLSIPWRSCFEEAWKAYCAGSPPIGAVLSDANGKIIARGHNRVECRDTAHPLSGLWLAHAEIDVLSKVDLMTIGQDSILWSTLEPCCMCMSAIRMAHIGRVNYVLADHHGGGAELVGAIPYFRRFPINVDQSKDQDFNEVVLSLILAWNCRAQKYPMELENLWRDDCPRGIDLSHALHEKKILESLRASRASAEQVFRVSTEMLA